MCAKRLVSSAWTEEAGVNAVAAFCTKHKLIHQGAPRRDVGLDCFIEVASKAGHATGFMVAGQIKSGASYKVRTKQLATGGAFAVRVEANDIAYWASANLPVFLFYADVNGRLYARHVQQYLHEKSLLAVDVRTVDFDDSNLASAAAAEYIRSLETATPRHQHRMELIRTSIPKIEITQVDDSGLAPSILKGASADGAWIAYELHEDTPKDVNWSHYTFANIHQMTRVSVSEQLGAGTSTVQKALQKRLRGIREALAIQKLNVSVVNGHPLNGSDPANVALCFGSLVWNLVFESFDSTTGLTAVCHAFSPPRKLPLVLDSADLADLCGDPPPPTDPAAKDFFEPMLQARQYERIVEIAITPDHKTLVFALATNEDNSCFGSAFEKVFWISVAALRQRLLETLI